MHYVDAILQMTMNWNGVSVTCSEVEAGNLTTSIYSVLHNVGKTVLRMLEALLKNSLIIAKIC
jgi:hypothetical protein